MTRVPENDDPWSEWTGPGGDEFPEPRSEREDDYWYDDWEKEEDNDTAFAVHRTYNASTQGVE